jgi:hypothetical protein
MKRLLSTATVLVSTFWLSSALAGPLIDSSAGVKLLAGADVWSTPSNIPAGAVFGLPGSAGGFSYGGLGYYELRIIKFIGIEADLSYQRGSFKRKTTFNDVYEYTESVDINSLRLPILAKLNLPMAVGRFWLGVGPEFTLYQSSSGKVEQTGGPGTGQSIAIQTRNVKPTYGTAGLGFVLEIPIIGIDIPIEFRASKDLSQPSNWNERVTYDANARNESIRAESSWVFRLGVGLGYRF